MPIDENEYERVLDERDRYKQLARGALVQQAIEKVFGLAQATAREALHNLQPDELEALEAQLEKTVEEALAEGMELTLNGQKLNLKG